MTNVSAKGLSLDTIVVASRQQVSCDVADEAVLLSLRDGEYYGLNGVGASIWRLIQRPCPIREIRDALLEGYDDVDSAECERAVLEFLNEMTALELVEVAGQPVT